MLTSEGTVIPIKDEMELLGVTLDNKLKFVVKSVAKLVSRLLFSIV